jgi:hypothetical protein
MKKLIPFFLFAICLISCNKDKDSFMGQYQMIPGTWQTHSILQDSSGIMIAHSSPFDRLVIDQDLGYQIFRDLVHKAESGTINIVTQTKDKLEVYFDAEIPLYSSFAGSHIFGVLNVVLVSLTSDEMIFRAVESEYFPDTEFHFKR